MQWTALKQIYDNKKMALESINPIVIHPTISRTKKIIVWLFIIFVLGIIGFGIYFAYKKFFTKPRIVLNPPLTTEQFTNIITGIEKLDADITLEKRSTILMTDTSLDSNPEPIIKPDLIKTKK